MAFEAIGPVPFAARQLEDLGASVITVTRPVAAHRALPGGLAEATGGNVGTPIAIDCKNPDGAACALALMAAADVVIEGFRPGVMERLGLGPADVRDANDAVVYARVTGWGQDGPYSSMAGHDINYIGLSGALAAIGSADAPAPPLNLLGDYAGGAMFAVTGILAALVERRVSGAGSTIDVAMVDGVGTLLGPIRSLLNHDVWSTTRSSNLLDGAAPFYTTYRTSDGRHMAVGALEPAFYDALIEGLDIDSSDLPDRFQPANWPELRARLADRFGSESQDYWTSVFDDTDACVTPVLAMDEVMGHPHNHARRALESEASGPMPARAPRFEDHGPRTPPTDTPRARSVLMDIGLSADEVDRLITSGIVGEW